MSDRSQARHRIVYMLGLIVAGEAVFALPFHVARFFRPTVLEVFGLTNTELGTAQGVYGVLAMIAYFPGGPLADRFPARKLLALSLWATAAGGLYMSTIPDYAGAVFVWGFYGVSTILLFWGALIRATRDWGDADEQGRAYGLLDGGRGILAAGLASIAVASFGFLFPDGYEAASFEDKKNVLRLIILGYSLVTAATGAFVWYAITDGHPGGSSTTAPAERASNPWRNIPRVIRMPAVWLQALVVVCAYVGYKGFDNYSLFAVEGYGIGEVEAARLVALGAWVRPVAALGAGLLGDRLGVARMTALTFLLLLASDLLFALDTPDALTTWVLVTNTLVACAAIFGLRGLYFALFEEARVPAAVTGTAVGIVSVLGYTPDIFVTYVGGVLLDASPGLTGHQHFFFFLAAFAALGLAAALGLVFMLRKNPGRAVAPS